MIKGVKKHITNGVQVAVYGAANTAGSAAALYTVPSGKTFVLTNIVCDWTGQDNLTGGNMVPGVGLIDSAAVGNAVGTFSDCKILFHAMPREALSVDGTWMIQSLVVTDIENGPGFTTGVAAINLSTAMTIPAYGIQVGGYLI